MRELSIDEAFCPHYHQAVELIGKRWTGVVLRALLAGCRRYADIRRAVPGLSDTMLTERLRELEAEGVVTRHVVAGPPTRVEYLLTDKGESLHDAVMAITAWAEAWRPATRAGATISSVATAATNPLRSR